MKNSVPILRIITFSLIILISQTASPAFAFPSESLDQAISGITNPESLVRFMREKFKFEEDEDLFDQEDYWQTPEEFWQKKSGDCEDYALFARYVLKKLGYEVRIVSFYDEYGNGHTMALYRDQGFYNIIDTKKLLAYKTKTIEESVSRFYPEWSWGAIAEQQGSRGWLLQRISPN